MVVFLEPSYTVRGSGEIRARDRSRKQNHALWHTRTCTRGRTRLIVPRMTTPNPNTIGQTLEQLLESVIFSDPATHALRDEWERTKAVEQAVFERVCREEYEGRKTYHEICRTPNPNAVARHEANLLRPVLMEELDARLTERWEIIRRKVAAVLADKAAAEETPEPGTGHSAET